MRRRGLRVDVAILALYLLLAVLFFLPVTLGGKTLLPADNVFQWEPWRSYADQASVSVPHNALLSDLYLENYAWKQFIVESIQNRELPLWSPYLFAGAPFLAAGQHSALYPLSIVFYVLPLWLAYGWFAALHLFLAGALTYVFGRTLRMSHLAAFISGLAFMFCGFMVIRIVFPMILAAAVWLPLILTAIELSANQLERRAPVLDHIPSLALGAVAFGMSFLAGHPEMYFYVGLTAGAYALWRLVGLRIKGLPWGRATLGGLALLTMAVLGLGLGAGQWVPMLELLQQNFRTAGAPLKEVLTWAYPPRRVIALLIPDFFGNPAHHSYLDPLTWQRVPVTVNAYGESIGSITWGIKNYVEGAGYTGIFPLALAAIALLKRRGRHLGFFALAALVSLLFVFGSPLYALVYALPGLSQVHSPFRWIYVYSLAVAIMAGMGVDALGDRTSDEPITKIKAALSWLARVAVPWGTLLGGLGVLAALAVSLLMPDRAIALGQMAMDRLALAPQAFADGQAFYGYQFRNLAIFGGALAATGALVLSHHWLGTRRLWSGLAAAVIIAEMWVIGMPFYPKVDRTLVEYRTPAIEWLAQDEGLYRITSLVGGSEKTFNSNAAMLYGFHDVRGYDSIIPKQYTEYMALIQPQGELIYNRIAPITADHMEALDSPLLDLLGAKYVLTAADREIPNAGYQLVYDGDMRIYQNMDALPRAFLVPGAQIIPDKASRDNALRQLDPRRTVILEEQTDDLGDGLRAPESLGTITTIDYTANEVTLTVRADQHCFLVLADSWFQDWVAYTRPPDAEDPSLAEQALHIYRADGNFRAVELAPGEQIVRFKFSPTSVKYGLYISFLAGVMLVLGMGLWLWTRRGTQVDDQGVVQRVTKNTVAPITMNLVNKVIDMAFAMLMLRILGPWDAGEYYLAIVVVSWFDILINFGLNTLVTREVSRDRSQANRYLSNTLLLRLGLWGMSLPILGVFFGARALTSPLDPRTMLAILLFAVGLLPSNMSASLSAVFNAYEKMEIPASVTTITTLLKVALGTVALVLNTSFLGLAVVSIVTNLITMVILYVWVRWTLFKPKAEIDWSFQRQMLGDAYPLMINLLLATLFFKVAIVLLEWLLDDTRVVGWYSTAYKYIDAVGLIPSYFTMAIFPLMSRYASDAKDTLMRAYLLACKLLWMVAIPGALVISAFSTELITVLGGSQYLPYAADILRVMIWYMPIGFINSVTQYVLIALDQQRFLTRAFAIGLTFCVAANIILINRIGYMASAYLAIASEMALLIPFYVGIRKHLGPVPWLDMLWRQLLAAVPLAALLTLLSGPFKLLGLVAGIGLYLVLAKKLAVLSAQERRTVASALPVDKIKGRINKLLRRPAIDAAGTES